ncbi:alpha/beta hydrolase family protein [Flavobacterium sp. W1B]|uniref:alpha/beta hydrolase family protein n=1 Tax=Flavobacterium sp. W1B TaxID=3394146 RepID=UPI0039BD244B
MKTFNRNILLVLGLLWGFLVFSQTSLQQITTADYPKWGTLQEELLSPNGQWVSYAIRYDSGQDTTFVRNIRTGQTFNFPLAIKAVFASDGKQLVADVPGKGIILLNLKTATTLWLEKVIQYEFLEDNLITIQKGSSANDLIIYSSAQIKQKISNVTSFKKASNGRLAVIGKGFISILNANNWKETSVAKDVHSSFLLPVWNAAGTSLAFIKKNGITSSNLANNTVCLYDVSTSHLKILNRTHSEQLNGYEIISSIVSPLLLDDTGSVVFFYVNEPQPQLKSPSLVEVWDTETPFEFPVQRTYGHGGHLPKLVAWHTNTEKITMLGTNERPSVELTSDRKYALSYDPAQYIKKDESDQLVDYYITNILTGNQKPFLSKQSTAPFTMASSPNGRYISYPRKDGWYIYDIWNEKKTKIIAIDSTFKSSGWSSDNQKLILYDEHDVWLLSPDGLHKQRITNGHENDMRYEVYEQLYRKDGSSHPADFKSRTIDLSKDIILKAIDTNMKSGYFIWNKNKGLTKLIFKDSKIDRLQATADGTTYMFMEQSAILPPKLLCLSNQKRKPVTVFQSNKHSLKYAQNRAELITYCNPTGKKLSGVLLYPTNYKEGNHYPMIVKVYEKQSATLHTYYNPTMFDNSGFVPSNYTNDGYFVLLPDIIYEIGNPGKSAVVCIEASVRAVIEKGKVDKNRIGLIGHSFGGYEVAFTVTQSALFAAAVSGAAVTDLISSYLSLGTSSGNVRFDKFETQQYRLGKDPFSRTQNYLDNSPVIHAAHINTPLLSWTGMKDKNVDWKQSLALHLALRRLKKENILLVYPDEGHVLKNLEARSDLSVHIRNWFRKYLKK